MLDKPRFSLADLIDYLALDGPRDRALVLRAALWLHENTAKLLIEGVSASAWDDVTVTLQMQAKVSLVVTGSREDLPGDWTWKIAEKHFPDLWLRWRDEAAEGYLFCALDFEKAGQIVLLPTGDRATVLAVAMVAGGREVRVKLHDGRSHSFSLDEVVWL